MVLKRRVLMAVVLTALAGVSPVAVAASGADACQSRILIANARILDGTGRGDFAGAVRICDDRIAAVGVLEPAPGDLVIDAGGLTLAPGFIDTHSHHDDGIFEHRDVVEATSQGITTIVVGQDGGNEMPIGAFFARLQGEPAAVNVASYSGHNTLRRAVLGEDFKRVATAAEVGAMETLLETDLANGALGLSTGLEYDPGIYSDRSEVVSLAKVAAAQGGRYISHIRSEDRNPWGAIEELIDIGREAGIPVQVSHMKLAMTDWWGQSQRLLDMLDGAQASGVKISADIYPYPFWQSTLRVLWPKRDFENPETAAFVLKHLAPPEGLIIGGFSADPSLVGKTVAEIASERKSDAVTTVIDLLRQAEATKGSIGVMGTSMDEGDIGRLMAWPNTNISSDGGIGDRHPRGAGSFTRVLAQYVRERRILTLPQAIHKMTGLSAKHMGIADRGTIRAGAYADLVLFDPATVQDRATTKQPSLPSTGIDAVWVNGKMVLRRGAATGERPGMVLRRQEIGK